jgi:hypothetical protein
LNGATFNNTPLYEVDLKNSKNLNPNLEKEIKQKYPHLLKPNYEIKECNDEKKRIQDRTFCGLRPEKNESCRYKFTRNKRAPPRYCRECPFFLKTGN